MLLFLLCAVIQGCGQGREDSTNGSNSGVSEDTESSDNSSSANPGEGTPPQTTTEEEGTVSALSESLIATYESGADIEGFKMDYQSFSCPSCTSTIRVSHWTRACGLCSYKKYADYNIAPGQHLESCNDGRRTRVFIYGASGDRSLYFWNFQFWNCS